MSLIAVNPKKLVAQRLQSFPELNALVPATQIHPGWLPQNAVMPAIVTDKIDDARDRTLDGASGLGRPRMQIDIYTDGTTAAGYGEADRIAIAVRHALEDYAGLGHVGERPGFEDETQRCRISQDYQGLLIEED